MQALPLDYYQACVWAGEIREDAAQLHVVQALHELAVQCNAPRSPFARLFGARRKNGLYIYGPVGRGKTMLMDMFYESVAGEAKRRTHFHAFMAEVHARLHELRQKGEGDEVMRKLAAELARETRLLCFDEFQVYNIADAMILGRLFRFLFRQGVVVVATSNSGPDELYAGGLQRQLFLPFIELIKKRLNVLSLSGPRDYRQARLQGMPVYLVPHDNQAYMALQKIFERLTDTSMPHEDVIDLGGRRLFIPKAAKQVAWFSFADLCRQPLAAADYLKLSEKFHTILLEDVPVFTDERRDETLRFIHLVDVLYDQRAKLVMSAAAKPEALLPANSMLAAQFSRTASRLAEMQSQDYLQSPPVENPPAADTANP